MYQLTLHTPVSQFQSNEWNITVSKQSDPKIYMWYYRNLQVLLTFDGASKPQSDVWRVSFLGSSFQDVE